MTDPTDPEFEDTDDEKGRQGASPEESGQLGELNPLEDLPVEDEGEDLVPWDAPDHESGHELKGGPVTGSVRLDYPEQDPKGRAQKKSKRKRIPLNSRPGMVILAGLFCCLALFVGCMALLFLLQARPQFVGPPLRVPQLGLQQGSPRLVLRRVHDDVSVYEDFQPESADVRFDMTAHSDYRGLRTVNKMIGSYEAVFTVRNNADDAAYILFRCPHPKSTNRNGQRLSVSALKLQADIPGTQENSEGAWLWTGRFEAGQSAKIKISYNTPFLTDLHYSMDSSAGLPIKDLRLAINVSGDVEPTMAFESDSGGVTRGQSSMVWHRKNFLPPDKCSARIVESRSIYDSLSQLLQIAPFVGAMFLLAVLSVIMSRQKMNVLQVLTIGTIYSLYFPLILYLSAKFEFYVALTIALVTTGVLLLNFSRILLGFRLGFIGGLCFLLIYQVLPTLAAFAGWNRGMVLLVVGVVTLFVLVDLQNRLLRGVHSAAGVLLLALLTPAAASAQGVQVIVPAEIVKKFSLSEKAPRPSQISFGVVDYTMKLNASFVDVRASLPLEVLRAGEDVRALFTVPVYLSSYDLPECLRLLSQGDSLQVQATGIGKGGISFHYRVPLTFSGDRVAAKIPLLRLPSGRVTLSAPRPDLEFEGGVVWARDLRDPKNIRYDLGVVDCAELELKGVGKEANLRDPRVAMDAQDDRIYGIRITSGKQLTVINSDGSCVHFAMFELPAFHPGDLELDLPVGAKVISVSVNGFEVARPKTEGRRCRIPLAIDQPAGIRRRVSIRLGLPRVELGFVGNLELEHIKAQLTIGELSWVVVLPTSFTVGVVSSGLDVINSVPDLTVFGDYGVVLRRQKHLHLARTLAPPRPVTLDLKYRQRVRGMMPEADKKALAGR